MNEQQPTNNFPPALKVCGLTKLDQIQELIDINTNFLGFIFYEKSPRYVLNQLNLEDIAQINHQGKVGVFVNEKVETIVEIAEKAKLNLIQLHGDEDDHFILELKKRLSPDIKIIKVIRIGNDTAENKEKIVKTFNDNPTTRNLQPINYYLFDTDSKAFGGTGQQFDWNLLNEFEIPLPYFLSGGISEENIKNMEELKQTPFALDINSKFETAPGDKDVNRIKKFKTIISISPNRTPY
ncbi:MULTISPECIES: phosphoribosylanthranilate isomerase [unclassified Chryseobacterium]|uniref:phosphoribosylanthranilate isomerase n=1 Tax=unclassified Chryseobacterium TaxID=2593645 RepID=UPI00100B86A0|nr:MULTISPECIES: phosphoribosylanthranilate isomerase [unclassified Chryseobacterium]RXM53508.1 phosphoribosylanthranilate isomerase [Chryseobacterium sp. CH25]RXM63598.1 phosphoribosylanthranilate isomerase [Chryseobacterium sp. CH1]